MKTIVCMAVYNGIKYLNEQLESIRMQSVSADRVYIRDDCSTDGSLELIKKFIVKNGLENRWCVKSGEKNIGWRANFGETIKLAMDEYEAELKQMKSSGMVRQSPEVIILLSDQDDVWYEDRIKLTLEAFSKHENMELLVGSFDFIDDKGRRTGYSKNSGIILRQPFDGRFFHTKMPGCVYAVKADLLRETKDFWRDSLPHDAQIWMFALMRHSLFTYDRALISYRRHVDTATGHRNTDSKTKLRDLKREKEQIHLAMEYNEESKVLSRTECEILSRADRYTDKREKLLVKRTPAAALEAMQYLDIYYSFRTFLGDVYFAAPESIQIKSVKGKQF